MKTLAWTCSAALALQTVITPPPNKYKTSDDVELGRQAAAQARQQLPIMRDDMVTSYVAGIGERLVAAIPPELQHPDFHYTFEVVNVRDINAFALPGGPMFVNRGMIEAAHAEGEIAGVMAHELSHVVLRHGTAQATKATPYEIGEVAGAILGAIVGGNIGRVISEGTQFGLGAAFLRFSREYERQADLEGSHIMARAGYDPRDMANVFKTIEEQGGPGGPQWLSDHPNPGNRYEYITAEAAKLRVEHPIRNTSGFESVRAHLKQLPPAPTTEEVSRRSSRPTGTAGGDSRPPTGRVEPPSSSFRTYDEGNRFRVSVPSNWRELQGNNAVTFAPDGGYGTANGQGVFTHGMEFGLVRNESHDLPSATEELVASLARTNRQLRQTSQFESIRIDGRPGLRATASNVSEATGEPENLEIYTTQLPTGTLLYGIGVAPSSEFRTYSRLFDRIVNTIRM